MKALSIKAPHTERIATGEKDVEYRSWSTRHRGDFLVVASASPDREALDEYGYGRHELPCGVAICVVSLIKVGGEPGEFEWHLANPRRVRPFAVKGRLNFYDVDDALIAYTSTTARKRGTP